ncbi:MAG: AAA family ATPase [Ferrimicrobium sp.]
MISVSHPEAIASELARVGYLPTTEIATTVYLATRLGKPILVEGPAGTGKTELAKSMARAFGAELVRLQCYEGLDESKALYEWDYRKQLLALQISGDNDGEAAMAGIFGPEFLLERPLLHAITGEGEKVLLIDEVDRLEVETEALLLEVLSEFQVTIPELGTIVAHNRPLVVLTSNGVRELSEALKRRALFLYLDYPSPERERAIVLGAVPELATSIATAIVRFVESLRELPLKKAPSIAETLDWARALVALSVDELDADTVRTTLPIVLKYRGDIAQAIRLLDDSPKGRSA